MVELVHVHQGVPKPGATSVETKNHYMEIDELMAVNK